VLQVYNSGLSGRLRELEAAAFAMLRIGPINSCYGARHFIGAMLKNVKPNSRQEQRWQRIVPHRIETIYSAVADVQDYAAFLPWCRSSKVLNSSLDETGAGELQTEIHVGFDPLQAQFRSRVELSPLRRVHAVSEPNEFIDNLNFTWDFAELGERSCRLDLSLDFTLRNTEHILMWEVVKDQVVAEYVRCFQRRCTALEAAAKSQ